MKVLIKSVPETFRRAGIQFTREGVVVDASKLTAEQEEAIRGEPFLHIVGPVRDDQGDDDGAAAAAAAATTAQPGKKAGK